MARKKITSITQIEGGTNPQPRTTPFQNRPEYRLGSSKKLAHAIRPSMDSKNPMSRYVQGVIKDTRPTKSMSPLQQLRRK